MTRDQLELLRHLIEEAKRDASALDRRWLPLQAARFARARADEGNLLLVRDWTADIVISGDGEVVVIDTEDGQPPRKATASERRITLFRSIHRYPELLSFLPQRPDDAVTCTRCAGTGVLVVKFTNPGLRGLVCACGGAGWVVDEQAPAD